MPESAERALARFQHQTMSNMPNTSKPTAFLFTLLFVALGACDCGGTTTPPPLPDVGPVDEMGNFVCRDADSKACLSGVYNFCEFDGEFLRAQRDDCGAQGLACDVDRGCVICNPGDISCIDGVPAECNDDGTDWVLGEECDTEGGFICRFGGCVQLCEVAERDRSYVGCEFFTVDLDNAAIAVGQDASAQQYAVVVSNPGPAPAGVQVEVNRAPFGEEPDLEIIEMATVPPGDLEVFELPRREVDGSSSNAICDVEERECTQGEVCLCSSDNTEPPCFCRRSLEASGLDDGTHSALTSRAFRVTSTVPIIAYQFNPLDNVGVFSNDASLLLPVSGLSGSYTVVSWPQTIADGNCNRDVDPECANIDFDPRTDDEDLRTFLTIVGTADGTTVDVTMGPEVVRVTGEDERIPEMRAGDEYTVELDAFDVLNLETKGFNADFTGSVISATQSVSVFVGSEASDAPRFQSLTRRQCCADHLEEQLAPRSTLGRVFNIARMPPRTEALNRSFVNPAADSVAQVNEPEYIKVVAVRDGNTTLETTLPEPNNMIVLRQNESIIFEALQDFQLRADKSVAVLQALPSQQVLGIPNDIPGGDPAIIVLPPEAQYRQDYVFLAPDKYAFDFMTIVAPADAEIQLDGEPLRVLADAPDEVIRQPFCVEAPADGIERGPMDPPADTVIYRCQLSFPDVVGGLMPRVEDGDQNDGVHRLLATEPIGVVLYGFDRFVSYGYAGGLNLNPLPE